jgi:hypothetical protein
MKKVFYFISFMALAGLMSVLSCSRNESSPVDVEDQFTQAEKEAVTEAVLQKIDETLNREITALENLNYMTAGLKSASVDQCEPKITVETPANAKFPKTITLDWGSGCMDSEGNFRAGQVVVVITGFYWQPNTVRHARLVGYRFNDLVIDGERHEINKGANEKGYIVFDVKHSEKVMNKDKAVLVERELIRQRVCNRGSDLKSIEDDEIWVTGTAKVKNNGSEVIREITKPLYKKVTCQHFQSGTITTFVKKIKVAVLDYGAGECDNIATWTNANGTVTKTITLQTWVNHFSVKP